MPLAIFLCLQRDTLGKHLKERNWKKKREGIRKGKKTCVRFTNTAFLHSFPVKPMTLSGGRSLVFRACSGFCFDLLFTERQLDPIWIYRAKGSFWLVVFVVDFGSVDIETLKVGRSFFTHFMSSGWYNQYNISNVLGYQFSFGLEKETLQSNLKLSAQVANVRRWWLPRPAGRPCSRPRPASVTAHKNF